MRARVLWPLHSPRPPPHGSAALIRSLLAILCEAVRSSIASGHRCDRLDRRLGPALLAGDPIDPERPAGVLAIGILHLPVVRLLELRLPHTHPPRVVHLIAELLHAPLEQRRLSEQRVGLEDVLIAHERGPDLRLVFGDRGGRVAIEKLRGGRRRQLRAHRIRAHVLAAAPVLEARRVEPRPLEIGPLERVAQQVVIDHVPELVMERMALAADGAVADINVENARR
mmetsp:Transcript_38180/g.105395  ORF Transcript_38180/g.105395 Transcript_38180/m.105395 type:complete len:226 (+) Transcript_38180:149-826(+)